MSADPAAASPDFGAARRRLLATIDEQIAASATLIGRTALDPRVRAALAAVPRHRFVPEHLRAQAYADRPLPIGHGQTISQPFVVALMSELAQLKPNDRVLEIGTGSGYQAAVLAELVAQLHTVEIIPALGERTGELLRELGYRHVAIHIGDGYQGWPAAAPYDAIVVTAAPDRVPPPLVDQLAPGGRLVVPIGSRDGIQQLQVLRKQPDGRVVAQTVLPVRFVPLTREAS